MALPAFNGQVLDLQGNAVTDFEVEVRSEESGTPLASVFEDRDGNTPLGNPFASNPADNGHFRFYVDHGYYSIRVFTDEGDVSEWRDVLVGVDEVAAGTAGVAAGEDVFLNEDENLGDVGTAATAFNNVKQAASTSATGVVEKAVDAEVRAATADKYLDAALIESASAIVTLTDAATIAVDWDTGINFQVTLTTNRILGNPTNGQPGTWRTVLVKSDGGADTLTFGNQYGGEVPTIDDVTTTQFYLLMIYCKTSSQFIVSAIDGSDA